VDSAPASTPFLSIVTRCFKRPQLLERNKESVYAQLDQDWEHIFIVDDIGLGMEAANKSLALNAHLISGEYVLILDDDDILVDNNYVSGLRAIVRSYHPDVIISKMRWHLQVEKPERQWWRHPPQHGHIGSPCFAVRREVWLQHIESFGTERSGDFHFITAIWNAGCTFHWWKQVTSEILQIGAAMPEIEEVADDTSFLSVDNRP